MLSRRSGRRIERLIEDGRPRGGRRDFAAADGIRNAWLSGHSAGNNREARAGNENSPTVPDIRTELPGPKARAIISRDAAAVSTSYYTSTIHWSSPGIRAPRSKTSMGTYSSTALPGLPWRRPSTRTPTCQSDRRPSQKFCTCRDRLLLRAAGALGEELSAIAPMPGRIARSSATRAPRRTRPR